jgi:hypothetical protein
LLNSQGKIKVGSTAVPQPYITSVSLQGTNLVMSGTNGSAGQQYTLLNATNVALPVNQWTPVSTNSFTAANFSITNTVNPNNPNAPRNFYILRLP